VRNESTNLVDTHLFDAVNGYSSSQNVFVLCNDSVDTVAALFIITSF